MVTCVSFGLHGVRCMRRGLTLHLPWHVSWQMHAERAQAVFPVPCVVSDACGEGGHQHRETGERASGHVPRLPHVADPRPLHHTGTGQYSRVCSRTIQYGPVQYSSVLYCTGQCGPVQYPSLTLRQWGGKQYHSIVHDHD